MAAAMYTMWSSRVRVINVIKRPILFIMVAKDMTPTGTERELSSIVSSSPRTIICPQPGI